MGVRIHVFCCDFPSFVALTLEVALVFRRGAAQLRGVCLYGKLNYYIGARAKEEGRRSLFPSVDVSSHVRHFERNWFRRLLTFTRG